MLQEYKLKNKSNLFLDKRIGEKDNNLSAEDRMIARFTAERIKGAGKSSIFNLGDDFNLTHGGEKLNDIDKFDNPNSDQEDEDELLGKEFVDEAHFGGFMTKADDDFKSGKANSRKEYIENLIRESKKKKAEKRKAEEEAELKTQELDSDFNDVLRSISQFKRNRDDDNPAANYDPYDMLVKSLGFQKKAARPAEKLKTEEEKIKDEKERLQKLEEDRLRRMRGEKENDPRTQFSVEDIDGLGNPKAKKLTRKERRQQEKAEKRLSKKEEEEESENSDDGEEEEDGPDAEGEGDEGSEDEEDSDEERDDDNSDLDESDAEAHDQNINDEDQVFNEKDQFDEEMIKMMDQASKEIPYIIKVHDCYESFSALVWDRSSEDLQTILERILSTNHPQICEDKLILVPHYQHVLQYIQDLCQNYNSSLLNIVITHIAKLTGLFQQAAATCLVQVCSEKYEEFHQAPRPRYPGLDTVIFLHLVHLVCPTSDYRHPVTSPAASFMCHILASARPTDRSTFASCVSICSIMLEYVSLSKRVVPELINTLQGLLFVANSKNTTRPLPPCKGGNYLVLSEKVSAVVDLVSLSEVNSVKDIDDEFKVTVLHSVLKIIIKLIKLYREVPTAFELFHPLLAPISVIEVEKYPEKVKDLLSQIPESIQSLKKKRQFVVKPSKKTPMLKMLEPKIEEDFDPFVKKRVGKKDVLEQQKMRHKLKQEKKGARKEIRQDTAFLANQKMKEQKMKDADRQAKTKALFGSLASQEGDYKKLLKKKKKF